ncbi:MAG: hypothetical protein K1X31_07775 [Gemmatimonadaceae bacterium]|nr:hypothetical protein [Gemmatimonadaceae bacterium]
MTRAAAAGEATTLSRELSEFLIELSIGLHKNAIYPPGHPLLENTSAELQRRLDTLLKERQALSLGVARHQLIIEGVATEDTNPVLRELAMRLHRHHLGAVKFSQGVAEAELVDMLATVSVDAGRLPRPLGLEGPEVLARWQHIRLFPMTFAQLQLLDEHPSADPGPDGVEDQIRAAGSGNRAAQLWIGLARAALVKQSGAVVDPDDPESTDPEKVAQAIEEVKRDSAYDQVVVGYLLQIAEELKTKGGRDAAALQKRVSSLVETLSPETLKRLLTMGGDLRQRRKFVADAAQGMAVDAVVDLVKAAAETSHQNISHSMVRMLNKLAAHADSGAPEVRMQADGALRDQVQRLLSGWSLDDPNPDGYRLTLEGIAKRAPLFVNPDKQIGIEPERLLAMGLEIETLGEQVWRSVDVMASRPDLTPLLDLVDGAPAAWMKGVLWRHIATPARLRGQLALDPPPAAVLPRLAAQMGAAAAEPLLEALEAAADDRTVERLITVLEAAGEGAAIEVVARLPEVRWGLVRPLIAMLGKHPEWACGYDPAVFLTHPDGLVRREALRQQLRAPATREDAILRALADGDEATLRLGLGAAMRDCPRDAAAMLRVRADDTTVNADLRALGIRALASYKANDTATWLAARVVKVGKLLKRPALAGKTPELLAAIEGLATHWREHPAAREALALAAASADSEIREAAAPRGGGQ